MQYLPIPLLVWAALYLSVPIYWWIGGLLVGFILAVYGFSIGFHHTFSHATFKFSKLTTSILMYLGTNSTLVSPISWAAAHFSHHRFVDTELDPHSPKYLGWKGMFFVNHKSTNLSYISCRKLLKNKLAVWMDSDLGYWTTVLSFPAIIYLLFGVYGLIFLWCLPLFISLLAGLVFTYAHGSDRDKVGSQAKDSILLWVVSFGDGNHKLHHEKWNYVGKPHVVLAKLIGGRVINEVKN